MSNHFDFTTLTILGLEKRVITKRTLSIIHFFNLCFQGISEEVFGTLATMLPSIFRVSNPLVFKASSSTPHTPKSG